MPGIFNLLRCVGKAVVKNAGKLLFGMVPGGEAVYDIAKDALEDYRRDHSEAELRAELERVVQVPQREVHQIAQHLAASEPLELRLPLVAYLDQLPASIRQSLRRPTDPSGTTIPAGLSLKQPEDLVRFLPDSLPRFKPGDRPLANVDWELVELLGKGGFGEVWKARNPHFDSVPPVALKFCLDASAKDRLLRHEAAVLNQVMRQGHREGIVELRHTYLSADPPCLEYEYIEGGNLAGLIREMQERGKLTPDFGSRIIHRLASIVAYAHQLNPPLVHRDLKPANILVRREEGDKLSLFVADFGIGGVAAGQALAEQARRSATYNQTLPTAVRGAYTPLYASPQQVKGEPPDPRDDVHALGIIWYQLVTGEMSVTHIPPDWQLIVRQRGMKKEQIRLLVSCIASRPENRLASAGVLGELLAPLLKRAPEETAPRPSVKPDREVKPEVASPVRSPVVNPPQAESAAQKVEAPVPVQSKERQESVTTTNKGDERDENIYAAQQEAILHILFAAKTAEELEEARKMARQVADLTPEELRQIVSAPDAEEQTEKVDVGVLGEWLARPANNPQEDWSHVRIGPYYDRTTDQWEANNSQAEWSHVCYTPGSASIRGDEVYKLKLVETVTNADLAALSSLWDLTSLKFLDLEGCKQVTAPGLAHLRGFHALQTLDLSECMKVADSALRHLQSLTSLQTLLLKFCTQLTDEGLAHLAKLTSLLSLDLSWCKRVTDAGLACLRNLTSLRSLVLECNQVTDAGLAHLQELRNLEALHLRQCHGVTDAGLVYLRNFTALRILSLHLCRVSDVGLRQLQELSDLRSLDLSYCRFVTNAGLAQLQSLTALESLDLLQCEQVTEDGLTYLKNLTALRSLTGFRVTDAALGHLRKLTDLEYLNSVQLTDSGMARLSDFAALRFLIMNCSHVTDAGLTHLRSLSVLRSLSLYVCKNVTDSGLSHLQGLTALRSLSLASTIITGVGLAYLEGIPALQSLDLWVCQRLTDSGLAQLRRLRLLQSLALRECEITDAGLAHLGKLHSLQSLNLEKCVNVSDAGLTHLRGLTRLRTLSVAGCKRITDAGLSYLREFPALQSLYLNRCDQVSDKGLAFLRELPALRALRLNGCKGVTPGGMDALREALPYCRFYR